MIAIEVTDLVEGLVSLSEKWLKGPLPFSKLVLPMDGRCWSGFEILVTHLIMLNSGRCALT